MFIISLHYAPSKLSCHVLVIRWKIEFLGTKRHWFDFGSNTVCTILNLLKDSLKTLMDAIADGNMEGYCIRITEYSKVFFCIHFDIPRSPVNVRSELGLISSILHVCNSCFRTTFGVSSFAAKGGTEIVSERWLFGSVDCLMCC